jgi:DNA-binding NtrC family response regulator
MGMPLLDSRFAPREELACGNSTAPLGDDGRFGELTLLLPDGRRHRLRGRVTVGIAADNDVVIDDGHASRRHCVIDTVDGRVVVRDLASTNGTWLDNVRVSHAELRPGAMLTVGWARLRVLRDGDTQSEILGSSPAIEALRAKIARVATLRLPVLVLGETGTGKELVARALHDQSGRRGPFVPVNCGSIPRDLIESELFGHARGAFTGAHAPRRGLFEEADGGTLFLDEIGELPEALQTRLLRVLETGVVRPVGGTRDVHVLARIVAATHVDLEQAVENGSFRRDVYYRLEGETIATPPLRERLGDIPILAEHILADHHAQGQRVRLSPEAVALLQSHAWPGNVRELANVLRRAAALGGAVLGPSDLRLQHVRAERSGSSLFEMERQIIMAALERHHGNQRATAAALKMPRSSLNDRLRRYGIKPASRRGGQQPAE